jgi:hypothetical protein
MGIFDEPKRLGLLLASVKVDYEERPLTPIQAAEWIQEAIEELGGKEKVMERLDLSSSMINAFQNLLTKVSEDIASSFKWGKTDVKKGMLNFTAAHLMSAFEPEEQNKLFSACFELAQKGTKFPTKEELKRVKQYYNENKDVNFDDAIAYIFKMDRPPEGFTSSIFMAVLDKDVFDKLMKKVEERNSSAKEVAQEVLRKNLGENSVSGIRVMESGIIRVIFSKEGKEKFDTNAKAKSLRKNAFMNNLLENI